MPCFERKRRGSGRKDSKKKNGKKPEHQGRCFVDQSVNHHTIHTARYGYGITVCDAAAVAQRRGAEAAAAA